jgi:uncharacterized protein involved in exopolysaccharide biosynthesis
MTNKSNEIESGEFGLADIVRFFRKSWLLILTCSTAGLVAAVIFLASAPRHYEATIYIQISEFIQNHEKYTAVPLESPTMLVERMRLPSSYTADALRSCGVAYGKSAEAMIASIRVSALPGQDSVVRITLRRPELDLAGQCATGIFEMIRAQHRAILEVKGDELQKDLNRYLSRLKSYQDSISSMKKDGLDLTVNYLIHREAVFNLLNKIDDIEYLKAKVTSVELTRLISPINVTSDPVSPKSDIVIVLGILAGLLVGTLLGVGRALLVVGTRQALEL